jgi:cytochrome P450
MELDIGSVESLRDPTGYFARARQDGDVQWSEAQRGWVLLSHAEVESGFRDNEHVSSDRSSTFQRAARNHSPAFQRAVEMLNGWMNFRDPPAHTHLREPVRAAFTPRAVASLEGQIRGIVEDALDAFEGDRIDLSAAFAHPIPAAVIGAVLGVDGPERRHFGEWADDLGQLVFSLDPRAANEERVVKGSGEFTAFFGKLIARERANPSGSLLSAIIERTEDGLTDLELIGACTLLLFGGSETTTTLLINTLGLLLERPELMEWLRAHPEADTTAIDEFLRICGPARAMPRKVSVTHERCGKELRAGQSVYLCITSANHDAGVFEDPAGVDFTRDPNPHFGFGWGLHYCLGANLARLEARTALRTLFDRYPTIELDGELPPAHASAMGYGRRPVRVRLGR